MNNRNILSLILVSFMMALPLSCKTEQPEVTILPSRDGDKITLVGKWANEDGTRTSLKEDGSSIWWTTGEEINVFCGVNLQGKFVSTNDKSAEVVEFVGTFEEVPDRTDNGTRNYMAVYPYNSENERAGTTSLNITIPNIQTASKGSFADKLFPAIAVSDGEDLVFYNVGGGACFSVTSPDIESVTFKSLGGEYLAGKVQVNFNGEGGTPLINWVFKGQTSVTVKAPDGGTFEAGERYYAVFLPKTLSQGLSVKMNKYGESATKTLNKEIIVNRSRFGLLPDVDQGLTFVTDIPEDEIWYYTTDEKAIDLYNPSGFGPELISNSYENGKGILKFKSAIYLVPRTAFYECKTLSKIVLPNCISTIADSAFSYCDALSDIHFPTDLLNIQRNAFSHCTSLLEITLPEGLKSIGSFAFDHCLNLRDIRLPESVDTFGDGVLKRCDSFTVVDLSNTKLTTLPTDLFYGCEHLERVIFPETLQNIGFGVFEYSGITDFSLPDSFNGILDNAVCQECKNLKHVSIGHATGIGEFAFAGCSSLETLHIPESVVTIGSDFISRCVNLKEITGRYVHDDHRSVVMDGSLVAYALGGLDSFSYIIPDSITKIGGGVFSGATNLENVVFHKNVTSVGAAAFSQCSSLKTVSMDMVSEIGEGIFMACSSLERVDLSDNISLIPRSCFQGCTSLKKAVIPSNVQWIGCRAFCGCSSLDSLFCVPIIPPAVDNLHDVYGFEDPNNPEILKDTPSDMKFLIGDDVINNYYSATYWIRFNKQFVEYHYPDRSIPDYYISTDYSKDGEVTQLQNATEGAGINVVIMGDAFTDQNIDSGLYMEMMAKAADALFSEEPYYSYRAYFNVYAVNVVSATEGYDHPGRTLLTGFGNGTHVWGSDGIVKQYALKAVREEYLDNTLVIVLMNRHYYAGTCYMYRPKNNNDYGCGVGIAYVPLGTNDEVFRQIVSHEAGGHGFSKLADEYSYSGTIPDSEINQNLYLINSFGWYKNIDFTSDPDAVKWARFISDSRYDAEGIGVYEGACTYAYGAWRPTFNSMMRHNNIGFNAPSRFSIWYRINKLAYGNQWKGTYEDFVTFDIANRTHQTNSVHKIERHVKAENLPPLAPPVIIDHPWTE